MRREVCKNFQCLSASAFAVLQEYGGGILSTIRELDHRKSALEFYLRTEFEKIKVFGSCDTHTHRKSLSVYCVIRVWVTDQDGKIYVNLTE